MEKIIIEGGVGEIVEKKSRFIANVFSVADEEEAQRIIAEMKKKYWDARHNCMAYVINNIQKFSDDGEPQGTAGKPILDVITRRNISNVLIVVTRYFGGVLLGTGGLVRAYQKAANEGIDNSIVAEKMTGFKFEISTDYTGFGKIQYIASNEEVDLINTEYAENVKLLVVCDETKYNGFVKKVTEATAGHAVISDKEKVDFYKTENGVQLF